MVVPTCGANSTVPVMVITFGSLVDEWKTEDFENWTKQGGG